MWISPSPGLRISAARSFPSARASPAPPPSSTAMKNAFSIRPPSWMTISRRSSPTSCASTSSTSAASPSSPTWISSSPPSSSSSRPSAKPGFPSVPCSPASSLASSAVSCVGFLWMSSSSSYVLVSPASSGASAPPSISASAPSFS